MAGPRSRGVLGNDPFKRGAAARPPAEPAGRETSKAPEAATAPDTASSPKTTEAAKATAAPKTSAAPKPAAAPKESAAPKPIAAPKTAAAPKATAAPKTAAAPKESAAPKATEKAPVVTRSATGPVGEHASTAPHAGRSAEAETERTSVGMRALTVMGFLRAMLGQALGSEGLQRAYDSAQGAMRAMQAGIGTSRAASLDTYGGDPELVRQLLPLLDFLHDRYFRVTAHGTEHLPTGPAVLVANHSGALPLDGPMLKLALARAGGDLDRARWLLEDQVFYAPFLGTLLNRLGAVRASPENAVRLLGEGHPLIVFPEGIHGIGKPFTERYRLKRFGRGGFVKLALRLKVPIVPVAIVGAEESMPLFGKLPGGPFDVPYLPITSPLPLPAHWIIRFGPPIDLAGEAPGAEDDLARVHKLNERTRATIQQMLDEALRERTSVFKR